MRRRDLTPIHPGVYVDHTGPPSWLQRAWAAVLHGWPAALCAESALRAWDGPGRRGHPDAGAIHIAVDRNRHVVPPPGVVVHRLADLEGKSQWHLGPPRLRIEEAVVDDLAQGSNSVLEHGYLRLVERPHGLPRGRRQVAARSRGRIYRDVLHEE
ncbi:hypothetical protein [Nocardioides alcanivorans]|uniref:hypothetical protein n=1 Tax=Nocardioides alcanivorans TaxID=2897352 RepID=UPI001F1FEA36|nr:hypothetical protein [Nocardioides alcanivorans]